MDRSLWLTRLEDYLRLRQYSQETIRGYLFSLRDFFSFLEEKGIDSLPSLTREHLAEYRQRLFERTYRGRRISAQTQQCHLNGVKAFTRFLTRERYVLVDPARDLPTPKKPAPPPLKLLSERELEQLLDAPDVNTPLGLRNRAILEVLYSSALRNTELRDLKVQDVDLDRQIVRVMHGKGNKSRTVPLGAEATAWVEEYLTRGRPALVRSQPCEHLFITIRPGALCRYHLICMVAQCARQAGLKQRVTPHQLRHCCATHMLRRGAGIRHLQDLLGHASPQATQRYTQVEITDLKRVHRRCHPRERGV